MHDMIRILGHRWPMSKVLLLPVRVQGAEAPAEIAGAIKYANEFDVADVIITGRGGGSIEDLWAFNDERVARAIYASRLPVISAVGHEPDVTISDYVADRRASTPSNAAEIAVPDWREIEESLTSSEVRMDQAMLRRIKLLRERVEAIGQKRTLTDPGVYIDERRMELDRRRDRLIAAAERGLAAKKQAFIRSAAALDAMSPLHVLSRGYAAAIKPDGSTVKTVAELKTGDKITVRFADGSAGCTVDNIEENDNG